MSRPRSLWLCGGTPVIGDSAPPTVVAPLEGVAAARTTDVLSAAERHVLTDHVANGAPGAEPP